MRLTVRHDAAFSVGSGGADGNHDVRAREKNLSALEEVVARFVCGDSAALPTAGTRSA